MDRKRLINIFSIVALVAILLSAPVLVKSVYWVSVLTIVAMNVLLASSLRTIWLVGHISLGQVGFSLIGAYGSALLVLNFGFSFWLTLLVAGLLSAALALALGYPFLKVKGIYFAILTLLTAETFRLIAFYWKGLTGGYLGLLHIPSPSPITIPWVGVINFDAVNSYYYLTLVVVCLSLFVLFLLEHSYLGFKWRAIRDADGLAQSVGINVMWYKILNFAIACFFAGVAGALFAHYQHGLSPDVSARFGVMMSIYLLIYMVVGGEGRFSGPIIGAIILTIVSELARPLREYQPMMFGALSILVVLFMPEGLTGLPSRLKLWSRKLLKTN